MLLRPSVDGFQAHRFNDIVKVSFASQDSAGVPDNPVSKRHQACVRHCSDLCWPVDLESLAPLTRILSRTAFEDLEHVPDLCAQEIVASADQFLSESRLLPLSSDSPARVHAADRTTSVTIRATKAGPQVPVSQRPSCPSTMTKLLTARS